MSVKEEKKIKVKEEAEEKYDDDELPWWQKENLEISKKGERRWTTLVHNGVLFPPPYEPHGRPMLYEGKELRLHPAVEEIATMFAVLRNNDTYYHSDVFRQNFFRCFKELLNRHMPGHPVKNLALCDFTPIWEWHCAEREKKLSMTKEQKKTIKEEQAKLAAQYNTCLWDGKKEQIANFRVEPPGLFRGRGKHPLQGMLKQRIQPEDVTLNLDATAPIPPCPPGHRWGAIVHEHNVTWLATWRDNVTDQNKYVMLAPSSAIKGKSDIDKFQRARRLGEVVERVRAEYRRDWSLPDARTRQIAVAAYFVDKLALRVGNEKSEDEADTVGCCSLRVEHVTMLGDNRLRLDFLGKDSIRYTNEVTVEPQVYSLLCSFRRQKSASSELFDLVSPDHLNTYLRQHMDDLTAKVFRTYNASICLQEQLRIDPPPPQATIAEKMVHFNRCNTQVAILCNHQKAVSKTFHVSMHNLTTKLEYVREQIQRLQKAMEQMKKDPERAIEDFNAKEDEVQWGWLNAYGTEEQKEEYRKVVEAREAAGSGRRSQGGSKARSTSRKSPAASTKKKKKTSPFRSSTKVKSESESSSPSSTPKAKDKKKDKKKKKEKKEKKSSKSAKKVSAKSAKKEKKNKKEKSKSKKKNRIK